MKRFRGTMLLCIAGVSLLLTMLSTLFIRKDLLANPNAAYFQIRNVQASVEAEIEEMLRSNTALTLSEVEKRMLAKYGKNYLRSEVSPKRKLWLNPNLQKWVNSTNGPDVALVSPVLEVGENGFVARSHLINA